MKKIKVSICSSPTCYIQGARLFKELGNILCASLTDQTELSGTSCGGLCAEAGCPLAPCARVNGRLITGATAGEILQAIRHESGPALLVA
jgi:NADH:ubiquinone oxidoreductase subunit E